MPERKAEKQRDVSANASEAGGKQRGGYTARKEGDYTAAEHAFRDGLEAAYRAQNGGALTTIEQKALDALDTEFAKPKQSTIEEAWEAIHKSLEGDVQAIGNAQNAITAAQGAENKAKLEAERKAKATAAAWKASDGGEAWWEQLAFPILHPLDYRTLTVKAQKLEHEATKARSELVHKSEDTKEAYQQFHAAQTHYNCDMNDIEKPNFSGIAAKAGLKHEKGGRDW